MREEKDDGWYARRRELILEGLGRPRDPEFAKLLIESAITIGPGMFEMQNDRMDDTI